MEVSRVNDTTIKIKTKNALIVVDPQDPKLEGDVAIFTRLDSNEAKNFKLVITGPGEYEIAGIGIKADGSGKDMIYTLTEDLKKVIVLPSTSLKKEEEEGEDTAVIVKAVEKVDEGMLSGFSTTILILFGNQENINIETSNIKRLPKVNLKKKEELIGSIVLLANP